jgi:hypothetical protein
MRFLMKSSEALESISMVIPLMKTRAVGFGVKVAQLVQVGRVVEFGVGSGRGTDGEAGIANGTISGSI